MLLSFFLWNVYDEESSADSVIAKQVADSSLKVTASGEPIKSLNNYWNFDTALKVLSENDYDSLNNDEKLYACSLYRLWMGAMQIPGLNSGVEDEKVFKEIVAVKDGFNYIFTVGVDKEKMEMGFFLRKIENEFKIVDMLINGQQLGKQLGANFVKMKKGNVNLLMFLESVLYGQLKDNIKTRERLSKKSVEKPSTTPTPK